MPATASEEIRTEDRMGTKPKEKHHHAHWTLMQDKLHTSESTRRAHINNGMDGQKMVRLTEHNPSGRATKVRHSAVVYLCLLAALDTGISY